MAMHGKSQKDVAQKSSLWGLILAVFMIIIVLTLMQGGEEYAKIARKCSAETEYPSEEEACIKQTIRTEINNADHCEIDADCKMISLTCPLGCNTAVNRQEADRIRDMVAGFKSTCMDQCEPPPTRVQCQAGKCIAGRHPKNALNYL